MINEGLKEKSISALKMMMLMHPASTLAVNVTTLIVVWSSGKQVMIGNMESAKNEGQITGRYSNDKVPESVFCHLLHHLQNNDHNILTLLASDNGNVFLNYFKNCLKDLIQEQMVNERLLQDSGLPVDYVVNHIAGTFVETVQWWCRNGRKETPL